MGVGESHPVAGESIDMGSWYFRIWIKATGIPVAHVIHQDNDDIRCLRGDDESAREENC